MGCGASVTTEEKKKVEQEAENQTKAPLIPFYETISNSETLFKDMPESKSGRYIGKGIKHIPNYVCHLPIDKLDEFREQFWASRNQLDTIWLILRKCCEVDGEEAKKLLELNNQIILEKDMRQTYSKYQPNFIYHIPNFCVEDPFYEKDFDGYEKLYDTVDDANIKITVCYYNDGKQYQMKIRNKCTGFDLKHKFGKIINLNTKANVMRVLYKGQEIEDTHCMYYHGLVQDSFVYILSTEKDIDKLTSSTGASSKKATRKKARINVKQVEASRTN